MILWTPKKPYLNLPGDEDFTPPGTCSLMGHRMMMAAGGGLPTFNLVISTDQLTGYDVQAEAIIAGWDGITAAAVNVTINTGVQVGSTNTATPGMDFGTFPAGNVLTLTINGTGTLNGAGGGNPGGTALYTRSTMTLTNNNEIWGGGGGGGRGGGANWNNCGNISISGGGGGSGYGNSANTGGSAGLSHSSHQADNGDCDNACFLSMSGGTGGAGGGKGSVGGGGGSGSCSGCSGCGSSGGSPGGAAGNAIDGVSYVTKAVAGTITGPEVG